MAKLARLIFNLIAEFYWTAAGKPITTAAVIAYQPFGGSLGSTHYLPIHDIVRLAERLHQRTIGLPRSGAPQGIRARMSAFPVSSVGKTETKSGLDSTVMVLPLR